MEQAQELREAAIAMRGLAEAATKGPWSAEARPGSSADAVLDQFDDEIADCAFKNAEHIASWHPGVALVVADWLDVKAANIDAGNRDHDYGYALKVARTFMGED